MNREPQGPQDCAELVEWLVECHAAGEIGPREEAALQSDPDLAREFVLALAEEREWRVLAGTEPTPEAFKAALLERLRATPKGAFVGAVVARARREGLLAQTPAGRRACRPARGAPRIHDDRSARPRPRSALFAGLAALGLLLAWSLGLFTPRAELGRLGPLCRNARILSGGATRAARPGEPLLASDWLSVAEDGEAELLLDDGRTVLQLAGESRLGLLAPEQGLRLQLEQGWLGARVGPQPAGQPLRISTPSSHCTILGTRFELSASPEAARLEVAQGLVGFGAGAGPERVRVAAQEGAVAGIGMPRIALRRPGQADPFAATILITCDNLFKLYLNGRLVGQTSGDTYWNPPQRFEVQLLPGHNVLAVAGENIGSVCGLIVELRWGARRWVSGTDWKVSLEPQPGWTGVTFDDRAWSPAQDLGPLESGEWAGKVALFEKDTPARWIWSTEQRPVMKAFFRQVVRVETP